jgi:glutamate synthase domain-containing protein 3
MTGGLAVILGETGRNFAAGMSGGLAYVLDELGDFKDKRCNNAAVELEPVGDDEHMLYTLISRHAEATGSPRARWVLDSWEQLLPKFKKVFPHEYRRVLQERSVAQASSPVRAALEVAHG